MEFIIKRKNGTNAICLIDSEDFELISKYKWHIKPIGNNIYAESWYPKGKTLLMHRLIMGFPKMIDHKDGNGLNNQKNNLRLCNKSQNAANAKKKKGSSLFKGVSIGQSHGIKKDWYAYAWKNNKRYFLGSFKNEIDAAIAYNNKMIELHGEFAKINEI